MSFGYAAVNLDLRRFRLAERIDLDVLAEVFNLFNRANFGVPNNTFGSGTTPNATFGQPTAAFDS